MIEIVQQETQRKKLYYRNLEPGDVFEWPIDSTEKAAGIKTKNGFFWLRDSEGGNILKNNEGFKSEVKVKYLGKLKSIIVEN